MLAEYSDCTMYIRVHLGSNIILVILKILRDHCVSFLIRVYTEAFAATYFYWIKAYLLALLDVIDINVKIKLDIRARM